MNPATYNERSYQIPMVVPNALQDREELRETLADMIRWSHLLVLQEVLQTMFDQWPKGLVSTTLHFGGEEGSESIFMNLKWEHPDGDIHDAREGFFQSLIDLLAPFGEGYKPVVNQAFGNDRAQVTRQELKALIFKVTTPEEERQIKASGFHLLWGSLPTINTPTPRF